MGYEHPRAELGLKCLRLILPTLVAPLCLTSFAYTCLYAYIYARGQSYGAADWQRCLIVPNIGNLHLDGNRFCSSSANFAGQAYLSLLVGVAGAYVGLTDPDLLPLSIYTGLVSMTGILVYRESYPYFLDPHFESTTLLTLTKYIRPGMYDTLQETTQRLPAEMRGKVPPPDVCSRAYQVNLVFLCVQYGVLAASALVLALCLYALATRPHKLSIHRPHVYRFRGLQVLLCCTTLGGMLTMLVSKEVVAQTTIDVGRASGHPTNYPFEDNNLDLVSITTLLAVGSVIFGLCKPSARPFVVAAGVGMLNLTRTIPGMLGTVAAYGGLYYPASVSVGRDGLHVAEKHFVIWDQDQCADYVITSNKLGFTADADAQPDARMMCRAFMSSIGGQLIASFSILGLMLSSVLYVRANLKDLEEAETEEVEDVLRLRRRRSLSGSELSEPLMLAEEDGGSASPSPQLMIGKQDVKQERLSSLSQRRG